MKTLWTLHGFLGLPTDWNFLRSELDERSIRLEAIDLYNDVAEVAGFSDWTDRFLARVREVSGEHHLLGYSLGGRLALHAHLADPKIWKSTTIVSSHPGLAAPEEKELRIKNDEKWASAFSEMEWDALMDKWNAQSVFQHSEGEPPKRNKNDFDRNRLGQCLTKWSLGAQDNLALRFEEKDVSRLLWLTGERDKKFTEIGSKLALRGYTKQGGTFMCGHRVPWEAQKAFKNRLLEHIEG